MESEERKVDADIDDGEDLGEGEILPARIRQIDGILSGIDVVVERQRNIGFTGGRVTREKTPSSL